MTDDITPKFTIGSVDVIDLDLVRKQLKIVVHVYCECSELESECITEQANEMARRKFAYLQAEGFIKPGPGWNTTIAKFGHPPKESND